MRYALAQNSTMLERRCGSDRRESNMSIHIVHWTRGRRERARRAEDRKKPHAIDRFGSKIMAAMLFCICLSLLDAILTLFLISRGAVEINPVMAYFLDCGVFVFFMVKYVFTCAGLFIILIYKNCYLFGTMVQAKVLFVAIAIPYLCVINWELYLILFEI